VSHDSGNSKDQIREIAGRGPGVGALCEGTKGKKVGNGSAVAGEQLN